MKTATAFHANSDDLIQGNVWADGDGYFSATRGEASVTIYFEIEQVRAVVAKLVAGLAEYDRLKLAKAELAQAGVA